MRGAVARLNTKGSARSRGGTAEPTRKLQRKCNVQYRQMQISLFFLLFSFENFCSRVKTTKQCHLCFKLNPLAGVCLCECKACVGFATLTGQTALGACTRVVPAQTHVCMSVCRVASCVHASRWSMCAGTSTWRPCWTGPHCVRSDVKST